MDAGWHMLHSYWETPSIAPTIAINGTMHDHSILGGFSTSLMAERRNCTNACHFSSGVSQTR